MTFAVTTQGEAERLPRVLYVSGPMTGLPEFNYPAFEAATVALRAAGYTVVSPHELDADAGVDLATFGPAERRAALARDAEAVLTADGVATLPGVAMSSGARAELALAAAIPIPVAALARWLALAEEATP